MNATKFYLGINIKCPDGFESIGKFYLGKKREYANAIFGQLQGSRHVDEHSMLTIELVEMVQNLPFNLRPISCSLDEMTANYRMITKELFKGRNLEELI